MCSTTTQQLSVLSVHYAARRDRILEAWRKADRADPDQTTGRLLTLSQFIDHIPEMLDAFELRLRSRSGGAAARAADGERKEESVKHGLHRWQQGYRLRELINECGHLQVCLYNELECIAADHPEIEPATVAEAQRQIMILINETISESAGQYERMQQAEAAGHVGDLRGALSSLGEIERHRATLLHQVVHDLKSDVLGVNLAANLLVRRALPEEERAESATFLQQAVQGLNTMLAELMELARLQAGLETRKIARFDASRLLNELGAAHQPIAAERQLALTVRGPLRLGVEGDADRTRRLAKNLLGNALKYTHCGEVEMTWGRDKQAWWLMIKDTGPGLLSGPGAPLVSGLQEATASAKDSEGKNGDGLRTHEGSQVLTAPPMVGVSAESSEHQVGEGIGLSIVKRLCELLDASIEIATSADTGTTFRIVFPICYPSAKKA